MKQIKTHTNTNYNYNIHDILKISSDSADYFPDYFLTTEKFNEPDIILRSIEPVKTLFPESKPTQIAHGLYLLEDSDFVNSTFSIFRATVNWNLKRLSGKPTEISFDRSYRLFSKILKFPISSVFTTEAYIKFILHLKLILKNHTFLIGGCFKPDKSNGAIILSAMGTMGKTRTTLDMFKKIGGKYLSDDTVIVNRKGQVLSYPSPIRLRKFNFAMLYTEAYVSPQQMFDSTSIEKEPSDVEAIYLLERGDKDEIISIEPEEALIKLLAISRKLLPYYMERTILAYSYMNPSFDLYEIMHKEEKILADFLKQKECYTLRCKYDDPSRYTKLIEGAMK
jgi:hypothetical protein